MRFKNCTLDPKIAEAIKTAELLLTDISPMINDIRYKNDFKFNSGSGAQVAANLLLMQAPVKVFTYKPFNPWSSAIGYFDGESIHVNLRRLPSMSKVDVTANLLHEYAHYCGLTHGNNYKTQEKCLYSVPYYISENISSWI